MARLKDKMSVRQRAFSHITYNPNKSRATILQELIVLFGVTMVYAKTLYQSHRAEGKKNGELTEVFEVRDHKDGTSVGPYMFSRHMIRPPTGTVTSEANAIKRYVQVLQERTKLAKKL